MQLIWKNSEIADRRLQGVVKGIYVTAPELRKRPLSLEILANKIYGPSYVSFEYVLSRAGLIPEAVRTITSATPKRNRNFDMPLGCFSYRHLPLAAYSFGWTQREHSDGSGWLEARLFEDLRLDQDLFHGLDWQRLLEYTLRMPGATFQLHLVKLLRRLNA